MSVRTIAEKLHVSRASVSVWCRDIVLTDAQKRVLITAQIKAGNRGRMIGAEMNRQKKLEVIAVQKEIARKLVGKLTERDVLMLGIALYWGEGVKAQSSSVAIVNSDPETVRFALKWFKQLGVSEDLFRPYIFIAETHKSRREIILNFWSKYLGLQKDQFAKIVFLKGRPKKIYENHDSYYGVLALRVLKGSALKYRILGLIRTCKEQAGVAQWQ